MTLDDGTVVDNVGRFIGRLLTAVDYVLSRGIADHDAVLEIYFDQLEAVGIVAEQEPVWIARQTGTSLAMIEEHSGDARCSSGEPPR